MMAVGAADGKDSAGKKVVARNGWQKYVVYPKNSLILPKEINLSELKICFSGALCIFISICDSIDQSQPV